VTATLRLNLQRSIAILIFISAAATLIHPVFAVDATSSTTRREALAQKLEARKDSIADKIAAMKEKIASKEAALKTRLAAFKDKRKAEIADRVNTNLNRINENQTAQMQQHLSRMSEILAKLEARVVAGSSEIKDPLVAKAAIASSRASIATASSAVTEQSQKDYTITVTSESQVRLDAQKVRDSLKTDIMGTRKLVIEAKQSVADAIRIAKGQPKEATTSGY
jgi:Skp family chaperone for outer membrane proteins